MDFKTAMQAARADIADYLKKYLEKQRSELRSLENYIVTGNYVFTKESIILNRELELQKVNKQVETKNNQIKTIMDTQIKNSIENAITFFEISKPKMTGRGTGVRRKDDVGLLTYIEKGHTYTITLPRGLNATTESKVKLGTLGKDLVLVIGDTGMSVSIKTRLRGVPSEHSVNSKVALGIIFNHFGITIPDTRRITMRFSIVPITENICRIVI